eukprot:g3160.t1
MINFFNSKKRIFARSQTAARQREAAVHLQKWFRKRQSDAKAANCPTVNTVETEAENWRERLLTLQANNGAVWREKMSSPNRFDDSTLNVHLQERIETMKLSDILQILTQYNVDSGNKNTLLALSQLTTTRFQVYDVITSGAIMIVTDLISKTSISDRDIAAMGGSVLKSILRAGSIEGGRANDYALSVHEAGGTEACWTALRGCGCVGGNTDALATICVVCEALVARVPAARAQLTSLRICTVIVSIMKLHQSDIVSMKLCCDLIWSFCAYGVEVRPFGYDGLAILVEFLDNNFSDNEEIEENDIEALVSSSCAAILGLITRFDGFFEALHHRNGKRSSRSLLALARAMAMPKVSKLSRVQHFITSAEPLLAKRFKKGEDSFEEDEEENDFEEDLEEDADTKHNKVKGDGKIVSKTQRYLRPLTAKAAAAAAFRKGLGSSKSTTSSFGTSERFTGFGSHLQRDHHVGGGGGERLKGGLKVNVNEQRKSFGEIMEKRRDDKGETINLNLNWGGIGDKNTSSKKKNVEKEWKIFEKQRDASGTIRIAPELLKEVDKEHPIYKSCVELKEILEEKDQRRVKELWMNLDGNDNGNVSMRELLDFVRSRWPALRNRNAMKLAFKETTEIDGDGDSFVEPFEFRALLRNLARFAVEDYVKKKTPGWLPSNRELKVAVQDFLESPGPRLPLGLSKTAPRLLATVTEERRIRRHEARNRSRSPQSRSSKSKSPNHYGGKKATRQIQSPEASKCKGKKTTRQIQSPEASKCKEESDKSQEWFEFQNLREGKSVHPEMKSIEKEMLEACTNSQTLHNFWLEIDCNDNGVASFREVDNFILHHWPQLHYQRYIKAAFDASTQLPKNDRQSASLNGPVIARSARTYVANRTRLLREKDLILLLHNLLEENCKRLEESTAMGKDGDIVSELAAASAAAQARASMSARAAQGSRPASANASLRQAFGKKKRKNKMKGLYNTPSNSNVNAKREKEKLTVRKRRMKKRKGKSFQKAKQINAAYNQKSETNDTKIQSKKSGKGKSKKQGWWSNAQDDHTIMLPVQISKIATEIKEALQKKSKLFRLWDKLDENANGNVSFNEMTQMIQSHWPSIGINRKEFRSIFKRTTLVDGDGDSFIERHEFRSMLVNILSYLYYKQKLKNIGPEVNTETDRIFVSKEKVEPYPGRPHTSYLERSTSTRKLAEMLKEDDDEDAKFHTRENSRLSFAEKLQALVAEANKSVPHVALKYDAATKIQARARGQSSRKHTIPRKIEFRRTKAAQRIQSNVRRDIVRREYAEELANARLRRHDANLRHNAAISLQRNVRGMNARSATQRQIMRETAAVGLQSLVRRRNAVKETWNRRMEKEEQNRRERFAGRIQANVRGRQRRQLYTQSKESAVRIQAQYRGGMVRFEHKKQKEAATEISRYVRGRSTRNYIFPILEEKRCQRDAAQVIQCLFRSWYARSVVVPYWRMMARAENGAASYVQRVWRQHAAIARNEKRREFAATSLQACSRGRKVRLLIQDELHAHREKRHRAALEIQSHLRPSIDRRMKVREKDRLLQLEKVKALEYEAEKKWTLQMLKQGKSRISLAKLGLGKHLEFTLDYGQQSPSNTKSAFASDKTVRVKYDDIDLDFTRTRSKYVFERKSQMWFNPFSKAFMDDAGNFYDKKIDGTFRKRSIQKDNKTNEKNLKQKLIKRDYAKKNPKSNTEPPSSSSRLNFTKKRGRYIWDDAMKMWYSPTTKFWADDSMKRYRKTPDGPWYVINPKTRTLTLENSNDSEAIEKNPNVKQVQKSAQKYAMYPVSKSSKAKVRKTKKRTSTLRKEKNTLKDPISKLMETNQNSIELIRVRKERAALDLKLRRANKNLESAKRNAEEMLLKAEEEAATKLKQANLLAAQRLSNEAEINRIKNEALRERAALRFATKEAEKEIEDAQEKARAMIEEAKIQSRIIEERAKSAVLEAKQATMQVVGSVMTDVEKVGKQISVEVEIGNGSSSESFLTKEDAATRVQAVQRGRMSRRQGKEAKKETRLQIKGDAPAVRLLKAEHAHSQLISPHPNDVENPYWSKKTSKKKGLLATHLKSRVDLDIAKKKVEETHHRVSKEKMATKIQSLERSRKAKKKVSMKRTEKKEKEMIKMATKIQSFERSRKAKKVVSSKRAEKRDEEEKEEEKRDEEKRVETMQTNLEEKEMTKMATKIQSVERSRKAKKVVSRKRAEKCIEEEEVMTKMATKIQSVER